jgi:uncharacterized membrane protein
MKKIILLLTLFTSACANENIKIGNESYRFVGSNTGISTMNTTQQYSNTLLNQRTGNIATITGNLVVKITTTTAEAIAQRYGLTIVDNFPHLHIVFFASNGQNVFDLKTNMSKDSDIESVEIDLIENLRVVN